MTTNDLAPAAPTSDRLSALLAQHGELMTGRALIRLFHFGSERTFRRAAIAGTLPVPVRRLPGRSGWFAPTREVARWLNELDSTPDMSSQDATDR